MPSSGQARVDQDEAVTQRPAGARAIGELEALRGAVSENRRERVARARILELDLGPQAIHREPLQQRAEPGALGVEQQSIARAQDDEIEQELALRREQSAVTRSTGGDPVEIAADESLQE